MFLAVVGVLGLDVFARFETRARPGSSNAATDLSDGMRGRVVRDRRGHHSSSRSRRDINHGLGAGSDVDRRLWNVRTDRDHRGPGDDVAVHALVDVDQDSGGRLGVEGLARGAYWLEGAGPGDGQVEALRVVLGTVRLLG